MSDCKPVTLLSKSYIKDLHERSLDAGRLVIDSRIDDECVYTVYEQLRRMIGRRWGQANPDALEVVINSPGGDAFMGMAIAHQIADSPVPIMTRVVGMAASAGAMIFLGGHKRILAPGSRLMFHDSWVRTFSATAEHHRRQADLHDSLDREMVDFVCWRTGLDRRVVEEEMSKDFWYLDQHEAFDYGFTTEKPLPYREARTTASTTLPIKLPEAS